MNFGAKADGDGYSNSHMMQVTSADQRRYLERPGRHQGDRRSSDVPQRDGRDAGSRRCLLRVGGHALHLRAAYTGPFADAERTNFNDVGGNNIDPSIGFDSASGKVWVVYLIFGGDNPGLYVREVNTTDGEPAGPSLLLAGILRCLRGRSAHQLPERPRADDAASQGGVFVAYRHGYPDPNAVRLWRIGAAGFKPSGQEEESAKSRSPPTRTAGCGASGTATAGSMRAVRTGP